MWLVGLSQSTRDLTRSLMVATETEKKPRKSVKTHKQNLIKSKGRNRSVLFTASYSAPPTITANQILVEGMDAGIHGITICWFI